MQQDFVSLEMVNHYQSYNKAYNSEILLCSQRRTDWVTALEI